MITYNLACAKGHEFEGWFKDSAAYDSQESGGDLSCPVCGNAHVKKAIMAPAVKNSATKAKGKAEILPPQKGGQPTAAIRAGDELVQGVEVQDLVPLSSLVSASQLGRGNDLGEIQEGARHGGDRDAVYLGAVVGVERGTVTVIRGRLRRRAPEAVTSIARRLVSRRFQSMAASRWLSRAPSPQASTEAIQRPLRSSSPTA